MTLKGYSEVINYTHKPVLLKEATEGLITNLDGNYVDCTLGGGGHAFVILQNLSGNGRVIGIDQDEDAIRAAGVKLEAFASRTSFIKANFSELKVVLPPLNYHGFLFDLGVSSHQIDTDERGFSFQLEGMLDMRMDRTKPLTADKIVNHWDFDELYRIFKNYGEERFSKKIARTIIRERQNSRISNTLHLSEIIRSVTPGHQKQKTLARIFQALRIAVNGELDILEKSIRDAIDLLVPGGRIVIISYHSLEDRIVKNVFRELAKGCTCPSNFPKCVCGKVPSVKQINKKVICASEDELKINPRARSGKLRIAEKTSLIRII